MTKIGKDVLISQMVYSKKDDERVRLNKKIEGRRKEVWDSTIFKFMDEQVMQRITFSPNGTLHYDFQEWFYTTYGNDGIHITCFSINEITKGNIRNKLRHLGIPFREETSEKQHETVFKFVIPYEVISTFDKLGLI